MQYCKTLSSCQAAKTCQSIIVNQSDSVNVTELLQHAATMRGILRWTNEALDFMTKSTNYLPSFSRFKHMQSKGNQLLYMEINRLFFELTWRWLQPLLTWMRQCPTSVPQLLPRRPGSPLVEYSINPQSGPTDATICNLLSGNWGHSGECRWALKGLSAAAGVIQLSY